MTFRTASLALACATLLAPVAAHADMRDGDVIGSFQQLCTGDATSVAAIGQKAAAMQMQAGQSANQPSGAGGTVASQTWDGTLTSGPIQLTGSESKDKRGHMVTCGLSAPDVLGHAFQQDLINAYKLGKPSSVARVPNTDGMMLTTWTNVFGPNTVLQLMQSTTPENPGIMVSSAALTR